MRKSEVVPLFQMSFADLMQLGDEGDSLIERDAAELLPYGVDADYRTDLANLTQELKDFPTDEEFQGDVTDLTEIKDTAADAVKVAIRSIMVRVKSGFGDNTGKYRRFGTEGLDRLDDKDLVKCGKRVVRMATLFLSQLAAKGLTLAMITELGTKVTTLDNALDAQDDAIRLRDSSTEDRIELGNELYKKIVELFDYGKDYWITRSEAKYNDYVIYNTPSGSSGNTIVREADVAFAADLNVDISTLEGTDESTITIEISDTNLKFFSATTPGGTNGASIYEANIGSVTMLLSEFATLTGIDETRPFLTVRNSGVVPGHYKLTFTHMV